MVLINRVNMVSVELRFRIALLVLLVVVIAGSLGFMLLESLSFMDAFYFTIVTIATVGYGDIHPLTEAGKILSIILIISGVSTYVGVFANATEMLLTRREERVKQQKLNMIIGAFYSEAGMKLLTFFSNFDPQVDNVRKDLIVKSDWSGQEFSLVSRRLKSYNYEVMIKKEDLEELDSFLREKWSFLLRLLENPALLEHESFTQLLRAVLHLTEELSYRRGINDLPVTDLEHLSGDVKRVYKLLVYQWLDYMMYLKDNYPFLFSLALRTNPFDRQASPVVK